MLTPEPKFLKAPPIVAPVIESGFGSDSENEVLTIELPDDGKNKEPACQENSNAQKTAKVDSGDQLAPRKKRGRPAKEKKPVDKALRKKEQWKKDVDKGCENIRKTRKQLKEAGKT